MAQYNNQYLQSLAQKFLRGTIRPEEYTILENWYAERPDITPVWLSATESKQDIEARLLGKLKNSIKPVKTFYPSWFKVAAAAAVFIASAIGLTLYIESDKTAEISQYSFSGTEGHIRKVLLPDNSLVWLKGKSTLEYPSRFSDSTRNVVLHGEALFEVSKDKHHPFVIRAGNYVTRVLGTSFNIKENEKANQFKLVVLTGRVLVSNFTKDAGNVALKIPVLITPGKEFEALSLSAQPKITQTQTAVKVAVVNGTEYDMNLSNISFADVKIRIEKKFNVEIKADERLYQNCSLSANVTDQSLDNTLKVICAAVGASYTTKNLKITITGGGCN